jgi:2-polyprenyl-3-methyl-5-hydroxy-6-metoxy-1,4-benzoquinol methylase
VRRHVQRFASDVRGKRILELGSGRQDLGEDAYSAKAAFDASNEFIQSDVISNYGHELVDVTRMDFEEEFDIILCLNVLEHVYEFDVAIERIHRALKLGGLTVIVVPVFYPYHDEPSDYWRFTEHALRKMLAHFSSLEIRHRGLRQMPFAYFAIARK